MSFSTDTSDMVLFIRFLMPLHQPLNPHHRDPRYKRTLLPIYMKRKRLDPSMRCHNESEIAGCICAFFLMICLWFLSFSLIKPYLASGYSNSLSLIHAVSRFAAFRVYGYLCIEQSSDNPFNIGSFYKVWLQKRVEPRPDGFILKSLFYHIQ